MKFFSLLYQGDIHPAQDEKVLPAKEYSKLLDAEGIIEKAKEDAEKYLEEAEKECEILREEAKKQGLEDGLEKFNEQILFMEGQLKAARHEMQRAILPIALKAAKRIVAKELETFPETIVDIVLQAIKPISQSHHVTIYVNKEDKEILEQEKEKIKEILSQAETISIQEKADVERGGCIIQTEGGMINASIENQWRALERAFDKLKK